MAQKSLGWMEKFTPYSLSPVFRQYQQFCNCSKIIAIGKDSQAANKDDRTDDRELNASIFIPFVNRIWPGRYDVAKTQVALSKTRDISAYDAVFHHFIPLCKRMRVYCI